MLMEINFEEYLDDDGTPSDMAVRDPILFTFLTTIIETASEYSALPLLSADVTCLRWDDEFPCQGEVEVWIYAEDGRIGWECLECGDEGVIAHWERTPWDRRFLRRYH